jgi:glycosyltransferase involved in cell wall biosynthesis
MAGVTFSVTAHAKDIFHADNTDLLADRLRGVATVVTVSHYNVLHLRTVLPGARVRHVPNGLPMPPAVGPQADGPILCVARLVPKKGIDLLIQSLVHLDEHRPLEIVGDGPCRDELESLAASLGLAHRVHFRGALTSKEVDMAYRRCSMMVLPCRIDADGDRDGMPTVLVEAMARAIPVVSTAVIGLDELVTDGVTGRLVAPEDPEAIAVAIGELLRDPAAAERMGAAARDKVIAEFAPEVATAALLHVFDEAVVR